MKGHDTDNNFLDDLYSHSAKETPPEALDQVILKQAHDNVLKPKILPRRQWQPIFSVAAVLVLSVYIVLDTGEQNLGIDDFSLSEEAIRFTAPAFNEVQAPRIEERRLKTEKAKVEAKVKKMMNSDVYESSEEQPESKHESAPLSVKEISIDQEVSAQSLSTSVSADESSIIHVEKMIAEIERLIAEGKLANARGIYKELSNTYPEYSVPSKIINALK
jgi:hypothetical protein